MSSSQDPRIDTDLLRRRDNERLPPGLFQWRVAEVVAIASTPHAQATGRAPADARWLDDVIIHEVPAGARVLDLGCGDGHLLERLARERQVHGQGVEIDAQSMLKATARGVPVLQADLRDGLAWFPDHSVDVVILEQTLQTLPDPWLILGEMLRVGRRGIVSFPNFAHWRVVVDMVAQGRMPVTARMPFHWYDSDNIHPLTLQDFLDWVDTAHARIVNGYSLAEGIVRDLRPEDNLHAEDIVAVVEKR